MKVNILTQGFRTPNGSSWVSPLITNRHALKELGLDIYFYTSYKIKVKECDFLIVDSKYGKHLWKQDRTKLYDFLASLKTSTNKVYFYDLGDSTFSWELGVLPYVDKLFKTFIFKDKDLYLTRMHGNTIWNEYYFNNFGVQSKKSFSAVGENREYLDKIQLSYSPAFANHSMNSFIWKRGISPVFRRSFNFSKNFIHPTRIEDFHPASAYREGDVSCRMLVSGYSDPIEFHRNKTKSILEKYLSTEKLPRDSYFREIRNSKMVVSPFGWGEINCPRDYEVALSGAILLKPSFNHLDTWPPIFDADTVVQYKWDFSDLEAIISKVLEDHEHYMQYAINLQKQYKYYTIGKEGQYEFCKFFMNMIKD